MVILSVSVCNKKGRILLARQYVPMSRLRIEGLLSAFPKLIHADDELLSKQHTFIETSEVRYIYQPMDTLYLLLITNKQSNILQDLSTLRMIAKLVPEYCGGHDEETVASNAFNLLYALDEVVTPMGYRESINYKQIEDFVKMESAEEQLSEMITKSKHENAQEIINQKAKEFDKKRADHRKKFGSPGMASLEAIKNWRGSSSNTQSHDMTAANTNNNAMDYGDNVRSISSKDYFQQTGNENAGNLVMEQADNTVTKRYGARDSDSEEDKNSRKKKRKKNKMGGMVLGGGNKKQDRLFAEAEAVDKKAVGHEKYKALLKERKADDLVEDSNVSPVQIVICEKLYLSFDRDGAMKKFEVRGDMEVAVNDPSCTQCIIVTNIAGDRKSEFGKATWRLHPRMNAAEWKKGVLCLKDRDKKFRVGRSSKTSILKWRMTTSNDGNVPLTVEFWPEMDDGVCNINAQYTCQKALKNVIVTFPTASKQEPEVVSCNGGDTAFYRNDEEFQWILNDLSVGDEGSLEYIVEDVEIDDLYPIQIHFEIENTYSQIEIQHVYDIEQKEEFEYSVKGTCVAEKFVLET